MLYFYDTFSNETENEFCKLQEKDTKARAIIMQDIPFLPDGMESIYDYYLTNVERIVKPVHVMETDIPAYWTLMPKTLGEIFINGMDEVKGVIVCREPVLEKHIQQVEWYDEQGRVYLREFYSKYGYIYKKEIWPDGSGAGFIIYMSQSGDERIRINTSNGFCSISVNGAIVEILTQKELPQYIKCELESGLAK